MSKYINSPKLKRVFKYYYILKLLIYNKELSFTSFLYFLLKFIRVVLKVLIIRKILIAGKILII